MSQGWQATGGQDAGVRHRHGAGEESLNSLLAARLPATVLGVGIYLIAVSLCSAQSRLPLPARRPPIRPLFEAMCETESGGRSDLVGDGGRSFGPYQIQWKYWKDSGVPGSFRQVRDRGYAEQVMLAYWQRHCPEALAAGHYQILARVHNGGPSGDRRPETFRYWIKVRSELARR